MPDTRDSLLGNVRLMASIAACAGVLLAAAGTAQAADTDDEAGASGAATVPIVTAPNAAAHDEAPSSSLAERGPKNPANYEFSFVSVGAYQTWSLVDGLLYFGAGGGLGPTLYRYSKLGKNEAGWDPNLDIVFANAFLRLSPVPYIDLDLGPKISLGSALFDVVDPPQSAFSYGGYVDLRVGSPTVKFGPRFEYDRIAYATYFENGWRLSPLMVRVVH